MLIDTHCHINLYLVLDEILKEAKQKGIEKIIGVSMSEISLTRILEISEKYEMIYPALGIHPEEVSVNEHIEKNLEKISEKIRKNKENICAIGEIGLDHHFVKNEDLYPLQKKVFKEMLKLAQELNLPVIIHSKGAEKEVFGLLPSYGLPDINIHWYSGPEKFLKLGIDRGYYFSVTPAISYSTQVKKVVSSVNIDHLLLESDGPVKFSGNTGTPSMIYDVLRRIAEIKDVDIVELEAKILNNTKRIFPKIF